MSASKAFNAMLESFLEELGNGGYPESLLRACRSSEEIKLHTRHTYPPPRTHTRQQKMTVTTRSGGGGGRKRQATEQEQVAGLEQPQRQPQQELEQRPAAEEQHIEKHRDSFTVNSALA
eukprot:tig00000681_g3129.t1